MIAIIFSRGKPMDGFALRGAEAMLREGIVPASLLSVVDRAQTQYLHRPIAVLS
jgi:hypothetical protein